MGNPYFPMRLLKNLKAENELDILACTMKRVLQSLGGHAARHFDRDLKRARPSR